MNFCSENDKIRELVSASDALERRITEVRGQIIRFHQEKQTETNQLFQERLTEILTGKKSGVFNSPVSMKRVVLMWLTAYHKGGVTARELLNMRESLQQYSGLKFPLRVEAYSMFLGRLDKRYITRVKEGKEFRYHITMAGFRHMLNLIRLEKIKEKTWKLWKNPKKMEKESRERAFLVSQRTKITILQMEQKQLAIAKIPEIFDTADALEIYSRWGLTLVEAAESIRALQISASLPTDQAVRESAVNKGEAACNKLYSMITMMLVLVCWLCRSGLYAKNPDEGS